MYLQEIFLELDYFFFLELGYAFIFFGVIFFKKYVNYRLFLYVVLIVFYIQFYYGIIVVCVFLCAFFLFNCNFFGKKVWVDCVFVILVVYMKFNICQMFKKCCLNQLNKLNVSDLRSKYFMLFCFLCGNFKERYIQNFLFIIQCSLNGLQLG